MKVRSRCQLEQKASNIFQDLEKEYKPCETAYIISELTTAGEDARKVLKKSLTAIEAVL